MRDMHAVTRFITSRRTSWIVLVVAGLLAGGIFALGSGSEGELSPGVGLPDSAESSRATALQETLDGADSTSALLVFSRDGDVLSDADLAAVVERSDELAGLAAGGFVPPPTVSDDGTTALLALPLDVLEDAGEQAERADELREIANAGLPSGLEALLTGAEGFAVDIAAVFEGADFTLLLTTVIVVAVLLLVTYRSPWLWLRSSSSAPPMVSPAWSPPASRRSSGSSSMPRSPASSRCSCSVPAPTTPFC